MKKKNRPTRSADQNRFRYALRRELIAWSRLLRSLLLVVLVVVQQAGSRKTEIELKVSSRPTAGLKLR